MFHKQRLNRNKYQTINSGISQSGDDMIAGMLSLFEAPRCVKSSVRQLTILT